MKSQQLRSLTAGRGALFALSLSSVLLLGQVALADITLPGGAGLGSDLDFVFVGDAGNANLMTIDLDQAASGPGIQWDTPSPNPRRGVYDPEKWAVVFKFTTMNVPSGKTVKFKNNAATAPVVFLVSGNVSIAGTVNLDGTVSGVYADPGPGGFRGGRAYSSAQAQGSAGFGPGGGLWRPGTSALYGSYATGDRTYGNQRILPLIGGSGSGSTSSCGEQQGWGGGGAILIAATGTISVTGSIAANSGTCTSCCSFGAAGGGIRLVANTVTGNGSLSAQGVNAGRIRVEGNNVSLQNLGNPTASIATTDNPATIWPSTAAPSVRIVGVYDGATLLPAAADPHGKFEIPNADLSVPSAGVKVVEIEAKNVPTTGSMKVRMNPTSGQQKETQAKFFSGNASLSIWRTVLVLDPFEPQYAPLQFDIGFASLQARAVLQ